MIQPIVLVQSSILVPTRSPNVMFVSIKWIDKSKSQSTQVAKSPTISFSHRLQFRVQLLGRGPSLQFTSKMHSLATQFPELFFKVAMGCRLSQSRVSKPLSMDDHLCWCRRPNFSGFPLHCLLRSMSSFPYTYLNETRGRRWCGPMEPSLGVNFL